MLHLRFALAPFCAFGLFACSHDWDALTPTTGAGSGGSSSSSSSQATSSGGGGSSTANGGGGSGLPPRCGDGIINGDEQCDDGNTTDGDGCSHCQVECNEPGAISDPMTHHCYFVEAALATWDSSRMGCQNNRPGVDLAGLSTTPEASFAAALVHTGVVLWIGGQDPSHSGDWSWSNGEPWSPQPPWAPNEPMSSRYCIVLDHEGLFTAHDCNDMFFRMCERTPVGKAP